MVRSGWTKKMFIIGAVLDGLVAVVMLVPTLEALVFGFDEPAIPHQVLIGLSEVSSLSVLHKQHLLLYSESLGVASTG